MLIAFGYYLTTVLLLFKFVSIYLLLADKSGL